MRGTFLIGIVALCAAAVSGCEDTAKDATDPDPTGPTTGSTSSVTATESASGDANPFPACEDIWVVGNRLPADYEGCWDADAGGNPVEYNHATATMTECELLMHDHDGDTMFVENVAGAVVIEVAGTSINVDQMNAACGNG